MEVEVRQCIIRHVILSALEVERSYLTFHDNWLTLVASHFPFINGPKNIDSLGDASLELFKSSLVVFKVDILD